MFLFYILFVNLLFCRNGLGVLLIISIYTSPIQFNVLHHFEFYLENLSRVNIHYLLCIGGSRRGVGVTGVATLPFHISKINESNKTKHKEKKRQSS